ncbi:MAG: hypothetical protein K0S20_487, partial [Patescibacteria group bacterium]|nr:hypothetical protein [Patescibacteria group bacterium]
MRNLLLFLATIPLLFSRPPSAALAEGPLLDLSGSLTVLRLGQSPFAFSGITVRSGAELRIEPGVIINLSADGKVEISGSLESLGTATQPIIFQSKKHEVWDSFLCSSTAQKCAIAHTYFKDFRNGLTIRSSETTLSDISLIDGVRNVLEIESQKKDFLKIMNVSFLNRGRGREMEEMQLKINGPIQLVEANSISFINGASKERIPWAKTGITLNGATGAHFIASSFPYKCRP